MWVANSLGLKILPMEFRYGNALDKALGTTDWFKNYLATKVVILDCGTSDHKPMFIHPCGVLVRQNKPWHFGKMWLDEEGCHDMVYSS